MVNHKKYGFVKVLALSASNRGGLALIATSGYGTFWVRARAIGVRLYR
jgi:hypothetical protein